MDMDTMVLQALALLELSGAPFAEGQLMSVLDDRIVRGRPVGDNIMDLATLHESHFELDVCQDAYCIGSAIDSEEYPNGR